MSARPIEASAAAALISHFDAAWAKTGRAEGGYVDNPNDSGGITNHGITQRVARANGFLGDMRDLTPEQARDIAKAQYWDVLRLDDIAAISPAIAHEVFDSGFNAGQATAGKWLQDGLNAFNRSHNPPPDYPELVVDGLIGPATVFCLKEFHRIRGDKGLTVMLRFLNCEQGAYYNALRKRREKDEEFMFGWYDHRIVI